MAAVRCLVDPVTGEPARQEARKRIASAPVRDEPMGAVRHRDRQARTVAGPLPLEQGGEDLGGRGKRAGGEIGRLERWQAGSRVLEHAGPTEVVEVVPDPVGMTAVDAEAGDRAVDGSRRHVVGADAEPGRDARAKALEDDVGSGAEGACQLGLRLQVAGHRFLAGAERLVPRGSHVPHRIALGRLQPDDARAEPQELPRGVRPRQVSGQIDHEHRPERLEGRLHRRRR